MRLTIWACLLLISACGAPAPELLPGGKTYHVYFLGGQSNMEGWGNNDELPEELIALQDDFPIFMGHLARDHDNKGGRGLWAQIQPGFGREFQSNGRRNRLSPYFGPEISFSREMKRLFPDRNIAIVKYARSGASLEPHASHGGNFLPTYLESNGLNQYDFAIRSIRTAMRAGDIDGDGLKDQLVPAGIAWMQGEADALAVGPAQAYEKNLRSVMHNLRAEFGSYSMPVVIGKITDSKQNQGQPMMPYIDLVLEGKQRFVDDQACAALMTETDTYTHVSDGWHYTSDDYVEMGKAFARSFRALSDTCPEMNEFAVIKSVDK